MITNKSGRESGSFFNSSLPRPHLARALQTGFGSDFEQESGDAAKDGATKVAGFDDLSEQEKKSLIDSIDGLEDYTNKLAQGEQLSGEDFSNLIAYSVNVGTFKALLGKQEWSEEEFSSWVRKEAENSNKSSA